MIEKIDKHDFRLICDNCGDECDEIFDEFSDAVKYKTEKENGWISVKDSEGEWNELCPSCNNPRTIAKLKGVDYITPINSKASKNIKKLAELDESSFVGF